MFEELEMASKKEIRMAGSQQALETWDPWFQKVYFRFVLAWIN
jgi:hypothetical protein